MRLIAVLRRPGTMVALLAERVHPVDPDPSAAWRFGYRERVVPLSQVSESVCPWRDKDVKAWRALARVPRIESRAALAIIRAIIGSVADPETIPTTLPPLDSGILDLRPHLCTADGETLLLGDIADHLEAATASLDFPDWHWRNRHEIAALPAEFRRSFLWGLHLSSWAMVQITTAIFTDLELDRDPELRLALAVLLSRAERQAGVAWCEVLAEVAPSARARGAELVIDRELYCQPPKIEIARALVAEDWTSTHLSGRLK